MSRTLSKGSIYKNTTILPWWLRWLLSRCNLHGVNKRSDQIVLMSDVNELTTPVTRMDTINIKEWQQLQHFDRKTATLEQRKHYYSKLSICFPYILVFLIYVAQQSPALNNQKKSKLHPKFSSPIKNASCISTPPPSHHFTLFLLVVLQVIVICCKIEIKIHPGASV